MNDLKKILLAGLIAMFLVLAPVDAPKTQAFWGEYAQVAFHKMMDKIYDQLQGVIMGAAQQAAAVSLNGMVDNLMGGGGNSAFITNWSDYLIAQPKGETMAYMNDYLSQMTQGRGSLSGYKSEGFSGSGNYFAGLVDGVKSSLLNSEGMPKPSYEGDPSQMLASGNFKNLNLYMSGVNNPWSFTMAAQGEYQKKLEQSMKVREAKSVAYQGFLGTSGNGENVTFPGILAKENIANIQDLPNKIIASAEELPQVMVSAVVAKMTTQVMQRGFNSVQRINQNFTSVQNKMNSSLDSSMSRLGPGARFNSLTGSN